MARGNETKAGNIPAIERASGRTWQDWLRLFEREGAAALPHPEIAKIALAAMPESLENPEWWAQGTAIAFEQHAGLRVPGQSSTGDFRVSASRTVPFDRDEAVERWVSMFEGEDQLGRSVSDVRRSRTEKRTFWRAKLEGAGKIEIAAEAKGEGKSTISANHTALETGDEIESWRAHWKQRLAEL